MKQLFTFAVMAGLLNFAACSSPKQTRSSAPKPVTIKRLTANWNEGSAHLAKWMWDHYGSPTEAAPGSLIWKNVHPFKRITIYREGIDHHFPYQHKDLIEHVVNYRVPINRVDEMTEFNGSVLFDRTRGELVARGDGMAMNVLSLNIAHDILSGVINHHKAREKYAHLAQEFFKGRDIHYAKHLLFDRGTLTADPDETMMFTPAQAQEVDPGSYRKAIINRANKEEMAE